jgi:hypothetical protein
MKQEKMYAVLATKSMGCVVYHVETLQEFINEQLCAIVYDNETDYRLIGVFDCYDAAMAYEPFGPMFSKLPDPTKDSLPTPIVESRPLSVPLKSNGGTNADA